MGNKFLWFRRYIRQNAGDFFLPFFFGRDYNTPMFDIDICKERICQEGVRVVFFPLRPSQTLTRSPMES